MLMSDSNSIGFYVGFLFLCMLRVRLSVTRGAQ